VKKRDKISFLYEILKPMGVIELFQSPNRPEVVCVRLSNDAYGYKIIQLVKNYFGMKVWVSIRNDHWENIKDLSMVDPRTIYGRTVKVKQNGKEKKLKKLR
jgi:hypothetical protein